MSSANRLPQPAASRPPEILQGLDATDAGRPAREVLSGIAWEGPALDPETTQARDFLAQL